MALTRKQFREGFCRELAECLNKIGREIIKDRKKRGDKSRLVIQLGCADFIFPRRR